MILSTTLRTPPAAVRSYPVDGFVLRDVIVTINRIFMMNVTTVTLLRVRADRNAKYDHRAIRDPWKV